MVCLLCDIKILLIVFNKSYNCQTSHYLGRNWLPKPFLILPSLGTTNIFFSLQPKHLAYLSVKNSGYKQMKNVGCSRGLLSDIETHTVDTSFIQKKSNFAKCCFDICNAVMAQWHQKLLNLDIQSQCQNKSESIKDHIFCKIYILITSN